MSSKLLLYTFITLFLQANALNSVQIYRNKVSSGLKKRGGNDLHQWAERTGRSLAAKYDKPQLGASAFSKRDQGKVSLYNQFFDSSYYGAIEIGNPPQAFFTILDTGSADLVIAANGCSGCSDSTYTFDSSKSTSFEAAGNKKFTIQYGSGVASGKLAQDTISMAGYTVQNQAFAICSSITSGLLQGSLSGIMGMAYGSIASSEKTPFWQTLANQNKLPSGSFGFALTRFINDTSASPDLEPGGVMEFGVEDSNLYEGEIAWNKLTSATYWLIELDGVKINGKDVSDVKSKSAAIDTGTTLIGGPKKDVAKIMSAVPGAQLTKNPKYEGYYEFPCNTQVNLSFTFDDKDYPITSEDFNLGSLSGDSCLAAIFILESRGKSPDWIIGDAFLKNYYTVFRYSSPKAVGFAQLSSEAKSLSNVQLQGDQGKIPSKSIDTNGTSSATVNGQDSAAGSRNVHRTLTISTMLLLIVCAGVL